MPVSVQPTRFPQVANGATVDFPFGCLVLSKADLHVFLDDVEVTTGFTITGIGNPAGGIVTFNEPPTAGVVVSPERIIKLERLTNYQQAGDFQAKTVNPDFDRLWMALQQFETVLGLTPGAASRVLMLGRGDVSGAGAYRAQRNRIQDLADPLAMQDAATKAWTLVQIASSIKDGAGNSLLQLFAAPDGAARIGFEQSGTWSIPRTVEAKLQESASVLDKGADPTGAGDSTQAFISAGPYVLVPAGTYHVDPLQVDLSQYHGPGIVKVLGQHVAMESPLVDGKVVQKKMMEVFYGFDNGAADTQIYAGAQYAPQGVAYLDDNGTEKVFVMQSVGGTDWAEDEQIRITESVLRADGVVQNVTVISPVLTNSHAHLTALKEGGKTWLYTSAKTVAGGSATDGSGKGWAKMEWKGAATSDADITQFRVHGQPGSGHKYEKYGKGRVCASTDGRYIVMLSVNYAGNAGGYTLFVYDRKAVEAMADPLKAEPVYPPVQLQSLPIDGATAQQGEACDGRHIYVLWGSTNPFARRGITIHKMDGTKIRELYLDGPRGQYTTDELLNHPTLGFPASFEPEGLTLRGNELFGLFVDFFRNSNDVVTWEGYNWAPTLNGVVGVTPGDDFRWVRTTKPATRGVWNVATTYNCTNTTRRSKIIYSFRAPTGDAGEQPISNTLQHEPSVALVKGNRETVQHLIFQRGQSMRASGYEPQTGKYYRAFDYTFENSLRIFDMQEGSDNEKWASFRRVATTASDVLSVRSAQGVQADGAYIDMYTNASASSPGELRMSSSGTGLLRLQQAGATFLAVGGSAVLCYAITRPQTDNSYSIGSGAYRWTQLYAATGTIATSDERAKDDIQDIDSAVLRAWAKVNYCQFKFKDAVEQKGRDQARWHFGVIAQRVKEAFESEGLDPFSYGVLCYDEWEATDSDGVESPAGNRYGIRYEEALALECAYLRSKLPD